MLTNFLMRMLQCTKTKFLFFFNTLKRNWLHCLYRSLDGQKNTLFFFSVPGLREIHKNLKQQKKFNSRDGFFRKSPLCTFSCINPGFGGPLDKLWISFLVVIFIMFQKNALAKNFFEFHAQVQKCHFGKIEKKAFIGLFGLCGLGWFLKQKLAFVDKN